MHVHLNSFALVHMGHKQLKSEYGTDTDLSPQRAAGVLPQPRFLLLVLPPASPSRISTSEQRTPLQTGGSGEQQAARLSRGWRGSYQPRLLHQLLAAENPAVGAAVHVAGAVGAAALELVLLVPLVLLPLTDQLLASCLLLAELVLLPLTLGQIAAAAVVARNLGDPSRVCTPNTLHPCSGYNVNIYFISLSSLFRKMQTANGLGNGVSMPKGLPYPLGWIPLLLPEV